MAWIKTKTAVIIGTGVLTVAGAATWQVGGERGLFDRSVLDKEPPQVRLVRSHFTSFATGHSGNKLMGTGLTVAAVVGVAYGADTPARIIVATPLLEGKYDFIASLPQGNAEALQQEVKRQFGVVARSEKRETDVLLLKVEAANATLDPLGLELVPGHESITMLVVEKAQ